MKLIIWEHQDALTLTLGVVVVGAGDSGGV